MRYFLIVSLVLFLSRTATASVYPHDSVAVFDFYDSEEGFFLFEPRAPRPETAPVVFFLHGYGAINPSIYGGWIEHLVRQGYTVVYPRYQRNIFLPRTPAFPTNAASALLRAREVLCGGEDHILPQTDNWVFVGHSYGGVIAPHMAVRADELGVPEPAGMLLVAPGSGPFTGAVLDSYAGLPSGMPLLMIAHADDWVVGTALADRLYAEAPFTRPRYLLVQEERACGGEQLTATHFEAYAPTDQFDNGYYNVTYYRALQKGNVDRTDFGLLWPLLDGLLSKVYFPGVGSIPWDGSEEALQWQLDGYCEEVAFEVRVAG